MSSTSGPSGQAASSTDETQVHEKASPEEEPESGSTPESGEESSGDSRSAAAKMKDGALARTAQGRDLATRKARALRGATAGLASGSAAGASAGRGGPPRGTGPRGGSPASTARTSGNRVPSRPAPRRGGPRRVRLTAQRIDPWSVLKISFLVSVALGISGVVMVAVLWTVLSGMNVFSTINDFLTQITSGEAGGPTIDLTDYLGFSRVLSLAAVLGVLNVFLLTALATLSAFLYNICAALVGGAQVTLSDE
ncbi:hypothetical protein SGUI_1864 [Serinicoccus hydrothermalis]|uniref:DUF3566 domain-containing protein n=1 Tax=Serinicoccus hydrothermalis TaxID=1758689 RepID=A0A1B1NCS7_9MICO|nr:DUF3566 domain-containing protein [Serinicoccus hydrothermalis]ANS79260.1 hypothetical protein SGUI_1864 [Serinicoccus hydrothermalis]